MCSNVHIFRPVSIEKNTVGCTSMHKICTAELDFNLHMCDPVWDDRWYESDSLSPKSQIPTHFSVA